MKYSEVVELSNETKYVLDLKLVFVNSLDIEYHSYQDRYYITFVKLKFIEEFKKIGAILKKAIFFLKGDLKERDFECLVSSISGELEHFQNISNYNALRDLLTQVEDYLDKFIEGKQSPVFIFDPYFDLISEQWFEKGIYNLYQEFLNEFTSIQNEKYLGESLKETEIKTDINRPELNTSDNTSTSKTEKIIFNGSQKKLAFILNQLIAAGYIDIGNGEINYTKLATQIGEHFSCKDNKGNIIQIGNKFSQYLSPSNSEYADNVNWKPYFKINHIQRLKDKD